MLRCEPGTAERVPALYESRDRYRDRLPNPAATRRHAESSSTEPQRRMRLAAPDRRPGRVAFSSPCGSRKTSEHLTLAPIAARGPWIERPDGSA
jgi:hypothetical protein